ncbi:multidrug effflux MFS transporter [Sphingobium sufflavum]|uniref:multidrug effflux MFS transporter n=1 Tax=Sphingobium sufflavum TaxID=1129547 RepID=UPI001F222C2D|nr:multidrug effflux MFS transporter [Sphingobium sufflavum]MCE7796596.1 multidrug effflux MFS transporter [Sphingobium sufflavum]
MHSPLTEPTAPAPDRGGVAIGFREFVCIVAMLMAINALGIDTMLPALPAIATALNLSSVNQAQWVVSAYMIGFGATQFIYGPLADRFGRRRLIILCLGLYATTSLLASFAASFEVMIAARMMQGVAAACTRVLAVAIVRDRYSGREMARVMSLSFLVFLAVPMLAPSIGQLILLVAPWHAIFLFLGGFAIFVLGWVSLRLPETLHPEYRRAIRLKQIGAAMRTVVTNRTSIGYTLALTLSFGAMVGFINSAQQVFGAFGEAEHFPILFAFIAGGMAFASILNSRIVMRVGSRRVSHTALILFISLCAIHLAATLIFGDNLVSFSLFQFAAMFCSGLLGSNFGAMAMEPMGEIAGTAASVQGTISTLGGAIIGIIVGQNFDGTVVPVVAGYFLCSLGILAMVLFAENGRLFRPHHEVRVPQ